MIWITFSDWCHIILILSIKIIRVEEFAHFKTEYIFQCFSNGFGSFLKLGRAKYIAVNEKSANDFFS